MAKITFIQHTGNVRTIDIDDGISLMQGAVSQNIPGIDADCGGSMSCGTCRISISPEWDDKIDPASSLEKEMLDFSCNDQRNWRLSCQITVTPHLDGLTVHIPENQG